MPILSENDLKVALVNGSILYFSCLELNTPEPHYFVLVAVNDAGIYHLTCATSQLATIQRLINKNKFPEATFVWCPASDNTTPFTLDSFLNCNEYFEFWLYELWQLYQAGDLQLRGVLPDDYYHQVIHGYHTSDMIEEEVKEILPPIN